jgi:hypothetical protein
MDRCAEFAFLVIDITTKKYRLKDPVEDTTTRNPETLNPKTVNPKTIFGSVYHDPSIMTLTHQQPRMMSWQRPASWCCAHFWVFSVSWLDIGSLT